MPSQNHTGCAVIENAKVSMNVDQKSIETVFSIVICRQSGDKWQSKTLFVASFDLRLSIVLTFSIAAYPVWKRNKQFEI